MRVEGMQISNTSSMGVTTQEQGSHVVERSRPRPSGTNNTNYEGHYGKKEYTEEELVQAVSKANKSFEPFDRKLQFSIHEKTKQVMVKIIDSSNDEVIRELPPEKILDLVAHMMEVAGLFMDKQA